MNTASDGYATVESRVSGCAVALYSGASSVTTYNTRLPLSRSLVSIHLHKHHRRYYADIPPVAFLILFNSAQFEKRKIL